MAVAKTLKDYLARHGVDYQLVPHRHTQSSMETAEAAHIPGARLAKGVVLHDGSGYLLAVLPSTHHVDLEQIRQQLGRDLHLATEDELSGLFADCEPGAVPPVGAPYRLDVIVDEALAEQPDIYFEAGDHTDLIHVSGGQFQELLNKAGHGRISRHL